MESIGLNYWLPYAPEWEVRRYQSPDFIRIHIPKPATTKVVALSLITNYAAGLVPGALGHEQTLAVANAAAGDVRRALSTFLEACDEA
jgi:hypothetical protein